MPKPANDQRQSGKGKKNGAGVTPAPTRAQLVWLRRGLEQPGGKLPLFTHDGQTISTNTVRACLDKGWAEPWFRNPLKKDWTVCKLTHLGRVVAEELTL